MKTNRFSARTIPLAFLCLTLLAYGLLLPWLGLYWDDWPYIWNISIHGPGEVVGVFEHWRPFLWPIVYLTASLIPATPLAWQIFGLLMRFITGLAAWFCLRTVWPDARRHALTASLFFLVYPAFTQQWIPITYANQHFIPLTAYLLSLGLSIRSARAGHRGLPVLPLALGLLVVGILPTEYFIGMEILRPLFLWQVSGEYSTRFSQRIKFILRHWLPYILLWIGNLFWLRSFYRSGKYIYYGTLDLEQFGLEKALTDYLKDAGSAMLSGGALTWFQLPKSLWETGGFAWLTIALILASFGLAWLYLTRLDLSQSEPNAPAWPYQAILFGLLSLLAGRFPSWLAGLPLRFNFGWDRFYVSMMLGGSLFISGVLALVKAGPRRNALICLILALAVAQHFSQARAYQQDWARQKEFFWQLAWRAPEIRPQTTLFARELPVSHETDFSLTAPLNWVYAPENSSSELGYILLYPDLRTGGSKLPRLEENISLHIQYTTSTFSGSTDDSIAIYLPEVAGCLKILDPLYIDEANGSIEMNAAIFDPAFMPAIALSKPSGVIGEAPTPRLPEAIFGKEPPHGWCYYYEKAELARQMRNWPQVTALGQQASKQGYEPRDPVEWLVFIEGHARTGRLEAAEKLSRTVWNESPSARVALCSFWRRLGSEPEYADIGREIRQALNCQP